jgi:hypothetical protein
MTAVMAGPTRATTLRTLAWVEAGRWARHPLFLLGTALLAWSAVAISDDLDPTFPDFKVAPAFFLGLLGVFVGYQLSRSMARSTDAVDAAPADGALRSAALCLACLVPGAVGLIWVAWLYLASAVTPATDSAIGTADRIAILLAGAVATVGGPLFGVLVGRWTSFPFAGLVAAVLLVGLTSLGNVATLGQIAAVGETASRLEHLVRLAAPFAFWISADHTHQDDAMVGGSPWWHLAYIVLLCCLAVTAAMVHDATHDRRARLWRVLVVLGVLAVGCLALAVAADPTEIPL